MRGGVGAWRGLTLQWCGERYIVCVGAECRVSYVSRIVTESDDNETKEIGRWEELRTKIMHSPIKRFNLINLYLVYNKIICIWMTSIEICVANAINWCSMFCLLLQPLNMIYIASCAKITIKRALKSTQET